MRKNEEVIKEPNSGGAKKVYQSSKSKKSAHFNEQNLTCPKCNKTYSSRYNLNRHIYHSCPFQKIAHKNIAEIEPTYSRHIAEMSNGLKDQQIIKCELCNKVFAHKSSYYRHQKERCQKNREPKEGHINLSELHDMLDALNNRVETVIKENEELKTQLSKNTMYTGNNMSHNHINSHNTTNNIINNNIKILPFGKEDLSFISDEIYKKILSKGFSSVNFFVDHVHYNKEHPQNHNLYISNMKDNYVLYYDGETWQLGNKKEVIDTVFDKNKDILEIKFNELSENLNKTELEKKYKYFMKLLNNEDDEIESNMKNDIKLTLYNKRQIPIKTRKKTETKKLIDNK